MAKRMGGADRKNKYAQVEQTGGWRIGTPPKKGSPFCFVYAQESILPLKPGTGVLLRVSGAGLVLPFCPYHPFGPEISLRVGCFN